MIIEKLAKKIYTSFILQVTFLSLFSVSVWSQNDSKDNTGITNKNKICETGLNTSVKSYKLKRITLVTSIVLGGSFLISEVAQLVGHDVHMSSVLFGLGIMTFLRAASPLVDPASSKIQHWAMRIRGGSENRWFHPRSPYNPMLEKTWWNTQFYFSTNAQISVQRLERLFLHMNQQFHWAQEGLRKKDYTGAAFHMVRFLEQSNVLFPDINLTEEVVFSESKAYFYEFIEDRESLLTALAIEFKKSNLKPEKINFYMELAGYWLLDED